jgi:hypothetical protein
MRAFRSGEEAYFEPRSEQNKRGMRKHPPASPFKMIECAAVN